MHTLKYEVVNASLATVSQPTEINGQTATISFSQAAIDLVPVDHSGGTIALSLSPDALADFPESSIVTVTITAQEKDA